MGREWYRLIGNLVGPAGGMMRLPNCLRVMTWLPVEFAVLGSKCHKNSRVRIPISRLHLEGLETDCNRC